MEVIFNELAVSEMNDAIAYYELQFSGLGRAFKAEIKKAINRIIKYPKAWSTIDEDIRKYILHKFPYNLYYSLEKDHLYIICLVRFTNLEKYKNFLLLVVYATIIISRIQHEGYNFSTLRPHA